MCKLQLLNGLNSLDSGSWILDPGSGSWILVFWILDSGILDNGFRILDSSKLPE